MLFSLLVTAREGLEIALIITILLGYLRSIDQKQHFRQIWYGVGAATGLSLAVGGGLELASRELDGRVLEAFEGSTMLFAVAVLTWMLFWMKRQSAGISRELREQVDRALSGGSVAALVLLAFSSVGREGVETALFLFAGSTKQASGLLFVTGGIAGFALAGVAGVVLYYGAARLPLKQFFLVSGVVLMVLAAGLLTNALTALHGATLIRDLGARPWDTDAIVPMTSSLGKFLHTLLGYDSAPAMSQIVLYWSYLLLIMTAYLAWPTRPSAPQTGHGEALRSAAAASKID
ncbi:MAG TPA: FTR1 family protein [Dehalococcoidia bacterium]|nr:FTR1 family protein [Dehalococcoidia bacterium]